MRRVGIFGGTFDPIHNGHLAIAEEVRWTLSLAHIYMVPNTQQPLKYAGHCASPDQRLEMVRQACTGNPGFIPSDIELRRDPPSFTVDTLVAFRDILGTDTELWFILGADALVALPAWHEVERMMTLTRLAVVGRPGATLDLQALEQALPGLTKRTVFIEGPRLDISSSDLRRRIAADQPVRYQMPDPVIAYIQQHRLYREP